MAQKLTREQVEQMVLEEVNRLRSTLLNEHHCNTVEDCQNSGFDLIQVDHEVDHFMDMVGVPEDKRTNVHYLFVKIENGEVLEMYGAPSPATGSNVTLLYSEPNYFASQRKLIDKQLNAAKDATDWANSFPKAKGISFDGRGRFKFDESNKPKRISANELQKLVNEQVERLRKRNIIVEAIGVDGREHSDDPRFGEMPVAGRERVPDLWQDHLQNVYDSFEEFQAYDQVHNLAFRLGFDFAEDAWEANPRIQGSVYPEDYGVVPEQGSGITESWQEDNKKSEKIEKHGYEISAVKEKDGHVNPSRWQAKHKKTGHVTRLSHNAYDSNTAADEVEKMIKSKSISESKSLTKSDVDKMIEEAVKLLRESDERTEAPIIVWFLGYAHNVLKKIEATSVEEGIEIAQAWLAQNNDKPYHASVTHANTGEKYWFGENKEAVNKSRRKDEDEMHLHSTSSRSSSDNDYFGSISNNYGIGLGGNGWSGGGGQTGGGGAGGNW